MSLASLVALPSAHFRKPTSNFLVSGVPPNHHRACVVAQIGSRSRETVGSLGFVPLGSPFVGFSGRHRFPRDRAGIAGYGSRGVTAKRGRGRDAAVEARATSLQEAVLETVAGVMEAVKTAWIARPPTWETSFVAMASIFVVGSPALLAGLTKGGIVSAYFLGSVIWRAYGPKGLLTIILFYAIMGIGRCSQPPKKKLSQSARATTATKLKLKEKQKAGIAEKRSGRRGVASVLGSGTAAAICALCSIYEIGGPDIAPLWQLGYLASLCTKLSDTMSSEIGKAYGKTTYLITTLSVVPRGTEGAVSLEGTVTGLVSAIFLAAASYFLHQVDQSGAIIAVVASQVANLCESLLGASLQGRPGFEWLSNDIVNVANIVVGASFAVLVRKYLP